jgi:hypothetical protein
VVELVGVDGLDLVDVEVKLRRFSRNSGRDGPQLGVAAPDDGPGAGALRRAVVLAEAALVVAPWGEKIGDLW